MKVEIKPTKEDIKYAAEWWFGLTPSLQLSAYNSAVKMLDYKRNYSNRTYGYINRIITLYRTNTDSEEIRELTTQLNEKKLELQNLTMCNNIPVGITENNFKRLCNTRSMDLAVEIYAEICELRGQIKNMKGVVNKISL